MKVLKARRLVKEEKRAKRERCLGKLSMGIEKTRKLVITILMLSMANITTNPVMATDVISGTGIAAVDDGFNVVKTLIVGLMAGYGAVQLAISIFELSRAIKNEEDHKRDKSILGIAAGLMCVAGGTLIGLFV